MAKKQHIGRPKLPKKYKKMGISVKLRPDLISVLNGFCLEKNMNRGQYIESLIADAMEINGAV